MKKLFFSTTISAVVLAAAGMGALSAQATNYTAAQVSQHNTAADCWMIISGNVYNLTAFIPIHPGGNAMVPYCGTDATSVFNSIHDATAVALLPTYLIGTLAVADTTAPSVPTGLAAASTTSSGTSLSWAASADPDDATNSLTYSVYRNGTKIATTAAGVTTLMDSGLSASTTYSYTVSASDIAGNTSAQSPSISITTLSSATTPPLTPVQLANGTLVQLQGNPTIYVVQNGRLVPVNKNKKGDDDGMENENENEGQGNLGSYSNPNAGIQTGSVVHVGQTNSVSSPGNSAFGHSHHNGRDN